MKNTGIGKAEQSAGGAAGGEAESKEGPAGGAAAGVGEVAAAAEEEGEWDNIKILFTRLLELEFKDSGLVSRAEEDYKILIKQLEETAEINAKFNIQIQLNERLNEAHERNEGQALASVDSRSESGVSGRSSLYRSNLKFETIIKENTGLNTEKSRNILNLIQGMFATQSKIEKLNKTKENKGLKDELEQAVSSSMSTLLQLITDKESALESLKVVVASPARLSVPPLGRSESLDPREVLEEEGNEIDSQITIIETMESLQEELKKLEERVKQPGISHEIIENIEKTRTEIMKKWKEIDKIMMQLKSRQDHQGPDQLEGQEGAEQKGEEDISRRDAAGALASREELAQAQQEIQGLRAQLAQFQLRIAELQEVKGNAEAKLQEKEMELKEYKVDVLKAKAEAESKLAKAQQKISELEEFNRAAEIIKTEAQDLRQALVKAQEDTRSALREKEMELKSIKTQLQAYNYKAESAEGEAGGGTGAASYIPLEESPHTHIHSSMLYDGNSLNADSNPNTRLLGEEKSDSNECCLKCAIM